MSLRAAAASAFAFAFAFALSASGCVANQAARPASTAGSWRVVAVLGDAASSTLEGGVAAVTFSRDGAFAAIAGAQGAEMIAIPSRRRVRFIREAGVGTHALALSADGRLLATAGRGKQVRVWDVTSGAETAALALDAIPYALAFSARGDLLAVGGENLAIEVWDLAKRRPVWRKISRSAGGQVRSLTFSPDGHLLLSGAKVGISGGAVEIWDESPRVWDAASGAQLAALDEGQHLTAASADWSRIAGAGGTAVRVWERASGREIATLQHFPERESGKVVTGVGITPDGARAISLGHDGTLVVWDIAGERALWRVAAHQGNAEAFALSADGRYALTGARDGRARLWDLQTTREVAGVAGHTGAVSALAVLPADAGTNPAQPRLRSAAQDGRILTWSGTAAPSPASERTLTVAAESSWNPPPPVPGWDPPVRRMTFARAGETLLVCERERVTAVRAESGAKLWEQALSGSSFIGSISSAAGREGGKVAVAGGVAALLDLETGRPQLNLPRSPAPTLAALSPDERWIALGDAEGELWIAEASTGRIVRRLAGHAGGLVVIEKNKLVNTARGAAVAAVFSADGSLLATSGEDHAVRLWATTSGLQVGSLQLSKGTRPTETLAFSPDGRLLAVGEEGGRVHVLDSVGLKPLAAIDLNRTPGLEGAAPRSLAFGAAGPTLFVGTGRGAIAVVQK